jgi:NAD(P)-dependent dehydrogenase (short-subunit alcohol dehydrogenase family)
MAVNITGMFRLTKAALPHIIAAGGGSVVNLGSTSGHGGGNHIAYCVSKGAVVPFTKSLALDHAEQRVRVNAILPGATLTGMTETTPPDVRAQWGQGSVAGRIGMPEDIANAVAFLVSPQGETITGTVIEVGTLPSWVVKA